MTKKEEENQIPREVQLPLHFFLIQSAFARKLSEITGKPFEVSLLEDTAFYVRIGISDWKHNSYHPKWLSFLGLIKSGVDPAQAAHDLYLQEFEKINNGKSFTDCFSYSYDKPNKTVYLHFKNNFASSNSPLSSENLPVRREELTKIFREIKEKFPDAQEVEGSSWLYSYDSYKSLFPPEYISNLHPTEPGLKGNGTWGQFLTHKGGLNQDRIHQFIENMEKSKDKDQLLSSFPIPTYDTSASVNSFYKFFGI